MSLTASWDRVSRIGVQTDTPPGRARIVIVVNRLSVVLVIFCCLFVAFNLGFADYPLVFDLAPLCFVPVVVAPLRLNRSGRFAAASTAFVLGCLGVLGFWFVALGPEGGNAYYMLPLLAAIPLVFQQEDARLVVALMILTAVVLVVGQYGNPLPPLLDLPPEGLRPIAASSLLASALSVALLGRYTRNTTLDAEGRVEAVNLELREALSQLKEAQAQLIDSERQAAVGRLVAGLLHEINTPLGAIRSSTATMGTVLERVGEFVTAHASSGDGKRALRALSRAPELRSLVESSVARVSTLVDGLGTFVSLDASERKPVDVRASIDTALLLLAESLDRVTVKRELPDGLPEVHGFAAKLNQVFLSVLQNAAQAVDADGTVEIRAAQSAHELTVEIADDGRGIPEHRLDGLFEIGFTSKQGRVAMQLGLPMCKRHLAEIGGSIEVASKEAEGTTITIRLPLDRA